MTARILLPYDGSEWSDKAVKRAVGHAKLLENPEVTLFYVVREVHLPPSFEYGMRLPNVKSTREYLKELYQRMKSDGLEMLSRKKHEFTDAGINNVRTKESIGRPTEQILAMVSAEKTDLIILGSGRRSGIAKLTTLGSVSRSVSERAKCPVMIVH